MPELDVKETSKRIWTILDLISWSADHLKERGFENPRLIVELLLARALNCQRIELYINFDKPLAADELSRFKSLLKRRLAFEPLQYIIGETEFLSLRFFVDAVVLIPRPETEILTEEAIQLCRKEFSHKEFTDVLDIGTGCGNIAICIAHSIRNAKVLGIDISAEALKVAEKNLKLHPTTGGKDRVVFKQLDVFDDVSTLKGDQFNLIVSNPPYISMEEFRHLPREIKEYEPRIALCDEGDGLNFFKRICSIGKKLLQPKGYLLFEVAYNQSEQVKQIMLREDYTNLETVKDYSGYDRVVEGRLKM